LNESSWLQISLYSQGFTINRSIGILQYRTKLYCIAIQIKVTHWYLLYTVHCVDIFFLQFYKTLFRIPVSCGLLLFFTKTYKPMNHFSDLCTHRRMHCLQVGGQRSACRWISVFYWSFFSNDFPWQYIAIRIWACITIYLKTLLSYCDTPTPCTLFISLIFFSTLISFFSLNVKISIEINLEFVIVLVSSYSWSLISINNIVVRTSAW
jgi:hypothetical protein